MVSMVTVLSVPWTAATASYLLAQLLLRPLPHLPVCHKLDEHVLKYSVCSQYNVNVFPLLHQD